MFTEAGRDRLLERLLTRARQDRRIIGAAITGSAAGGGADRWSDIDLYFGVAAEAGLDEVLADWSSFMYQDLGALHHFDLHAGAAVYRAFLLPDCLEVDLAFAPASAFGARGPQFRAVFGEPKKLPFASGPDRDYVIGLAWHHVLHARISIERGRAWQAEYWISGVRDHALTLACLRHDLPAVYAKGTHALPVELATSFADALVRSLDPPELRRALAAATALLLREVRAVDRPVADKLAQPLSDLASLPEAQSDHRSPR